MKLFLKDVPNIIELQKAYTLEEIARIYGLSRGHTITKFLRRQGLQSAIKRVIKKTCSICTGEVVFRYKKLNNEVYVCRHCKHNVIVKKYQAKHRDWYLEYMRQCYIIRSI